MTSDDEIITVADTPDYVYTAGTKENVIYKDLGKTVVEGAEKGDYVYDWVAYVDGAEQEVAGRPENEKDPTYEYTDKGATTEIYVDEVNETVTVVKINYYLAEITDIRSDDDGEFATVRMLGTQDPLGDSVDTPSTSAPSPPTASLRTTMLSSLWMWTRTATPSWPPSTIPPPPRAL